MTRELLSTRGSDIRERSIELSHAAREAARGRMSIIVALSSDLTRAPPSISLGHRGPVPSPRLDSDRLDSSRPLRRQHPIEASDWTPAWRLGGGCGWASDQRPRVRQQSGSSVWCVCAVCVSRWLVVRVSVARSARAARTSGLAIGPGRAIAWPSRALL